MIAPDMSSAFLSFWLNSPMRMSGLVAAFAGILLAARLGSMRGDTAQGTELEAITMALLGGVSIFGGSGSLFGVFLSILIILSPVLAPIVTTMGINETHFGVVLVLNLMIGAVTPPVGVLMYIVCRIANVSIVAFAREAFWPIVALVAVLMLITFYPPLVVWLPDLIMK